MLVNFYDFCWYFIIPTGNHILHRFNSFVYFFWEFYGQLMSLNGLLKYFNKFCGGLACSSVLINNFLLILPAMYQKKLLNSFAMIVWLYTTGSLTLNDLMLFLFDILLISLRVIFHVVFVLFLEFVQFSL